MTTPAPIEGYVAPTVSTPAPIEAPVEVGVTKYAMRPFLNTKLRGGNIAPKPGGYAWRGLFAEWDWNNWIKPQVDRAVKLGLNAVRLIGGPSAVFSNAGTPKISQATYLAHWCQLADYCQQRGLYLYPAPVTHLDFEEAGVGYQDAAVTAVVTATAALLAPYSNVIAFDLFQEGGLGPTTADVLAMMAAVRAVAPRVPLTCSHPTHLGFLETVSVPYAVLVSPVGSDFGDYHVYADGLLPSDPESVMQPVGKPFLFGEYGAPQSLDTASRAARYAAMAAVHNRPGVLGSFCWALADQSTDPADQWGVWDNTGFGPAYPAASRTPLSVTAGRRADMADKFALLNAADRPLPYAALNMLSAIQARPTAVAYGWINGGNTDVLPTSRGLELTSRAAGDMLAGINPTNSVPVSPNTYYRATARVLAGATARTVTLEIDWYTAANAFIGASAVATGVDSVSNVLNLDVVGLSPANAAFGVPVVKPKATAAAGEKHYVNDVSLRPY